MSEQSRLHEVDPRTLDEMARRGEAVIIDVRMPEEYAVERIPGALLMPLPTFEPAALPTGGKRVVLHCAAGKRSAMAAGKLLEYGATEAWHLKGGLAAWKATGLPTLRIDPATGAVERRN
jgi:rhodanese-related sulfurtransferase